MEGVTEFDVRDISYKDYLELWECFLEGRQYKDQSIMMEVSSLRQDVHRAIYDELVLAILKVANKLDLSSFRDVGSQNVSIALKIFVSEFENFIFRLSLPGGYVFIHGLVCICTICVFAKDRSIKFWFNLGENWTKN